MERAPHILETTWREIEIQALQEKSRAIDDWLDHTDDLIELFDGHVEILTDLRGIGARVRTAKGDITDKIAELATKLN